ncbi:MAG: elongation factor 4 [Candidatus Coatesbacteria bacterium]|nr:MAG: elongation factor 4 [Candidatus Coatesbacteria bacterium]
MAADNRKNTRNFSIIAHIDHGKTTLMDRMLEVTAAVDPRQMREQFLDAMALERERGITIKMHPVTLRYRARDGNEYKLNIIDTPGHVDFTYEVSRSLAACEGAVLLVDASQGVEAQTVANALLAVENDLVLIPAINKIDLASAQVDVTREELLEVVGIDASDAVLVSAKEGTNVEELLERLVAEVPPPAGDGDKPLRALVFDAQYDAHRGVLAYVRLVDGRLRRGTKIRLMASEATYEVTEVGVFGPAQVPAEELAAGDVGYVAATIKEIAEARVGDTLTYAEGGVAEPLPGYREARPMVFASLFPVEADDYELLKRGLEKLALNDASLSWQAEESAALGFGFRCGFLGLLHMDVVRERLEREYELEVITTTPHVAYEVATRDGRTTYVENPARLPDPAEIVSVGEPFVEATVYTPARYVGPVVELLKGRRGEHVSMEFFAGDRVAIKYRLPLVEIIVDFFDRLKALSQGYASLDYDHVGYRPSQMVKLDVLLNGKAVDALSVIVHAERAERRGRDLVMKLRREIPRQLYEVVIQAAIGSRVIARETLKPMRKNVTAKCYGGDVTRKRKLLERQKAGKKRMKQVGNVAVPQEAFLAVLKTEN